MEKQLWMVICIIVCYLLDAWFIGSLDRFPNLYDLVQLAVSVRRRAAVTGILPSRRSHSNENDARA